MADYRSDTPSILSLVLWFLGLVIILVATWVLFTQTELNRYVPLGVVIAILLLVVGIAVMATSDRFRAFGPPVVRERDRYTYERVGTRGAEPYRGPPPAYGPGYGSPYDYREERDVDRERRP